MYSHVFISFTQQLVALKDSLKLKFVPCEALHDPVVLSFRLPSGSRIERAFSTDDLTKVSYRHMNMICLQITYDISQQTLYEYVFCIGEVNEGFCIETAMPCRGIPCSSIETLSQCGIDCSCLLSVMYSDDIDMLQSLSVSMVRFVLYS